MGGPEGAASALLTRSSATILSHPFKKVHEMDRGQAKQDTSLLYPRFLPPTQLFAEEQGPTPEKLRPSGAGVQCGHWTNSPLAPTNTNT